MRTCSRCDRMCNDWTLRGHMDVVTPSEGGEQYLCHSERTGGILELALGAFSFGKSMESLYPGICYHIPGVQSFLNARTWWHWRGHKDRHRDALALIDGIESMYVRVMRYSTGGCQLRSYETLSRHTVNFLCNHEYYVAGGYENQSWHDPRYHLLADRLEL
jgi:hypothetical protein